MSVALDRNLSLGEIEIERFLSEFSIVRNLHLFDLIPELEGFRLFKFCEWRNLDFCMLLWVLGVEVVSVESLRFLNFGNGGCGM